MRRRGLSLQPSDEEMLKYWEKTIETNRDN